jgi:hypothetical protein
MKNVAIGLAYGPKTILAVVAAGIFPDQDRPREDSSAIVETDAVFAQCLDVLCRILLEFHDRQYANSVPSRNESRVEIS